MPIHKIEMKITILAEGESLAEIVNTIDNMSMADIGHAITDGDYIGDGPNIELAVTLPDSEVEKELLAIGNDGTFFSGGDDE